MTGIPCTTLSKAQEAQVSRQAWPKPQVLTDLGDKQSVMAFLMDEWMGIQDFQRIDAPVLVAYLMGDDAARERAIADSFRNEYAMSALQKLYLAIEKEVVYEGDVAKYQERYDAIGKDADAVAALYAQSARRWRGAPHAPVASSRHGVKVEIGQRWRRVVVHGKVIGLGCPLTVCAIVKRHVSSRDAHDYATFENNPNSAMWLDDAGYCYRPDEWQLVTEPEIKVAVGQRWKSCKWGMLEVVEISNNAAARLSNGIHEDAMMSLDENGFCKFPAHWTFQPELTEQMAKLSPKVEVGQCWVKRTSISPDDNVKAVVTTVDRDAALLSTAEPGTLLRMPLTEDGRCRDRHEWHLTTRPK